MSDMLKDATARPWATTKDKPRKITSTGVLICNAVLRNSATTKQNAKGKGELEATANARLIVTAVNSYEPMLDALEKASGFIESQFWDHEQGANGAWTSREAKSKFDLVEAAIALAKGGAA